MTSLTVMDCKPHERPATAGTYTGDFGSSAARRPGSLARINRSLPLPRAAPKEGFAAAVLLVVVCHAGRCRLTRTGRLTRRWLDASDRRIDGASQHRSTGHVQLCSSRDGARQSRRSSHLADERALGRGRAR